MTKQIPLMTCLGLWISWMQPYSGSCYYTGHFVLFNADSTHSKNPSLKAGNEGAEGNSVMKISILAICECTPLGYKQNYWCDAEIEVRNKKGLILWYFSDHRLLLGLLRGTCCHSFCWHYCQGCLFPLPVLSAGSSYCDDIHLCVLWFTPQSAHVHLDVHLSLSLTSCRDSSCAEYPCVTAAFVFGL